MHVLASERKRSPFKLLCTQKIPFTHFIRASGFADLLSNDQLAERCEDRKARLAFVQSEPVKPQSSYF